MGRMDRGRGVTAATVQEWYASDSFIFASTDLDLYRPLYHVPRSQVWGGSRGGQSGNVHLHVREQFDLGRIHRSPGQPLCGRRGWYERELEELEVAAPCPRCAKIERRRRG